MVQVDPGAKVFDLRIEIGGIDKGWLFFRSLALITGERLLSVNIQCGHSLTPQHNQVIARPANAARGQKK